MLQQQRHQQHRHAVLLLLLQEGSVGLILITASELRQRRGT